MKNVIVERAKQQINTRKITFRDVRKTTDFDLYVLESYKVRVLEGNSDDINKADFNGVDVVIFYLYMPFLADPVEVILTKQNGRIIKATSLTSAFRKREAKELKENWQVKADLWYTPYELDRHKVFEWDAKKTVEMVKSGNIKAVITGKGSNTRYNIKGIDVIKTLDGFPVVR